MLADEYLPSDDDLGALPVELLALKLLQFLVEEEGSVGSLLNEHNIGNPPSWAVFRETPPARSCDTLPRPSLGYAGRDYWRQIPARVANGSSLLDEART